MKNVYQKVFVCLTSYQYMIADLMAENFYKKSLCKSIIILKYISGIVPKDNEYAKYYIIKRNYIGRIISLWHSVKPYGWNELDLYFFNDRDPISRNIAKRCKKKILVEEGLGTYFALPGMRIIGSIINADKVYVGYPELYKCNHRNIGILEKINYKELFEEKALEKFVGSSIRIEKRADIVFLGQASQRNDYLRVHENNILNMVGKSFPEKLIFVKPHPRDEFSSSYAVSNNVMLLEKHISVVPIEALIYQIKAKCIITMYSSAAVTIANMFSDLKIILTYKVEGLDIRNVTTMIETFANSSTNIFIPDSMEEFEKLLRKVLT